MPRKPRRSRPTCITQALWSVVDGNVIHDVRHAMNPNLIGTRQVRSISLDGDSLELGAMEQLETPGTSRRHRILWRRAPQS